MSVVAKVEARRASEVESVVVLASFKDTRPEDVVGDGREKVRWEDVQERAGAVSFGRWCIASP